MSADNEIAIVKFKDGYRVAEVRGCPSGDMIGEVVRNHFTDFSANGFSTVEMAEAFAIDLELKIEESGFLEYGVNFYDVDREFGEFKPG